MDLVVLKMALFDTDEDGKALAEPTWVGSIQDLRDGNPDDLDVEDGIQAILQGADEYRLGGGASPLVVLRAVPA